MPKAEIKYCQKKLLVLLIAVKDWVELSEYCLRRCQ